MLFLKRYMYITYCNIPNLALVARFLCREIISLPPLKVSVVFHHIRNGLLFPALSSRRRLGEGQAEQAVGAAAGQAAVTAVAVAALAAAGWAETSQGNDEAAAKKETLAANTIPNEQAAAIVSCCDSCFCYCRSSDSSTSRIIATRLQQLNNPSLQQL